MSSWAPSEKAAMAEDGDIAALDYVIGGLEKRVTELEERLANVRRSDLLAEVSKDAVSGSPLRNRVTSLEMIHDRLDYLHRSITL